MCCVKFILALVFLFFTQIAQASFETRNFDLSSKNFSVEPTSVSYPRNIIVLNSNDDTQINKLKKLSDEKSVLKEKLSSIQEERNELLKEISTLKEKIETGSLVSCPSNKSVEDLTRENRSLLEQITTVRQEKITLNVQMTELRERLQERELDLQKRINAATAPTDQENVALKEKLKDLEQLIAEKDEMSQTLESKIEEVERARDALLAETSKLKANWNSTKEDLEKKAIEAQSPYQEKIFALEEKIKKSDTSCEEKVEKEKTVWKEDALQIEEKLRSSLEKLEKYEGSEEKYRGQIKAVEDEKAVIQAKLDASLSEFNKKLALEGAKLQDSFKAKTKEITELKAQYKNAVAEKVSLLTDVTKYKSELSNLKSELGNATEKLSAKEKAVEKNQKSCADEISSIQTKHLDVQKQLGELKTAHQSTLAKQDELSRLMDQMKSKELNMKQEQDKLSSQLKECDENAVKNEKELGNKSKEEISQLQSAKAKLQNDLSMKLREYETVLSQKNELDTMYKNLKLQHENAVSEKEEYKRQAGLIEKQSKESNQKEILDLKNKILLLETTIVAKESELKQTTARVDEAVKKSELTQKQAALLNQQERADLKNKISELEKDFSQKEVELKKVAEESASSKKTIQSEQSQNKELAIKVLQLEKSQAASLSLTKVNESLLVALKKELADEKNKNAILASEKNELSVSKNTAQTLEVKNRELSLKLSQLEKSQADNLLSIKANEALIISLKKELATEKSKSAGLIAEKNEQQAANKAVLSLEAKNKELSLKISQLEKSQANSLVSIKANETLIASLKKELTDEKNENVALVAKKEELQASKKSFQDLELKNKELVLKLSEIEKFQANNVSSLKSNETIITSLKKELADEKGKSALLTAEKDKLSINKNALQALEAQNKELALKISQLEKSQAENSSSLQANENLVGSLKKKLFDVNNKYNKLVEDEKQAEDTFLLKFSNSESQRVKLEQQLSLKDSKINDLARNSELQANLMKKIDEMSLELDEKFKKIKEITTENKLITAQLNEEKAKLIDKNKRMDFYIQDFKRKESRYLDKIHELENKEKSMESERLALEKKPSAVTESGLESTLVTSLKASIKFLEKRLLQAEKMAESLRAENATLKDEMKKINGSSEVEQIKASQLLEKNL